MLVIIIWERNYFHLLNMEGDARTWETILHCPMDSIDYTLFLTFIYDFTEEDIIYFPYQARYLFI